MKQSDAPEFHTQYSHSHVKTKEPVCYFCNKPAGFQVLHEASTKQLDFSVRNTALEIKRHCVAYQTCTWDMIILEAKYHPNCFQMLFNKARQIILKDKHKEDAQLHDIAIAKLVASMEETRW